MGSKNSVEILFLREIVENKGTRERVIKKAISQYYDLCLKVLAIYELERVNDKYFREIRDYTENSYNKKKIKEEEIIFIRKVFVCYKISQAFAETQELKKEANMLTHKIFDDDKYLKLDNEIYQEIFDEAFDFRN